MGWDGGNWRVYSMREGVEEAKTQPGDFPRDGNEGD